MTCHECSGTDTRVIRTIPGKVVSRQHVCRTCGVGWWSDDRLRRGSLSAISSLSVAQGKAASSSNSSLPAEDPDLNSGASLQSGGRARSKQGAEFTRLLQVFCDRWQRSNKRPYPVVPADRSQLGRFMQTNGHYIEGFSAMVDRYVGDRRQFTIDRSGNHQLAWLLTKGLAMYGGTPRETAEQYSARLLREHEARKVEARLPAANAKVRDLVSELAESKAVGNG